MSNIVSDTPVLVIDRTISIPRTVLVQTVKFHLAIGCNVRIENDRDARGDRFRYEIRPKDDAMQVVDVTGTQIGLFADMAALIDYAEALHERRNVRLPVWPLVSVTVKSSSRVSPRSVPRLAGQKSVRRPRTSPKL